MLRTYRHRAVAARVDPYGVGLYSRVPLGDARSISPHGTWPQAATVVVTAGGRPVRLFLVHPPPPINGSLSSRHRAYLRDIGDRARALGPGVVVCGDFNAPPWSAPFRDLLSRGRLQRADSWRLWQGTWVRLPQPFRIPIDTCAAGRGVTAAVETGDAIGSDHRPLVVRLGAS